MEEANIAYLDGAKNKVRIDAAKCIHCGACIEACQNGAREYEDDTASFFRDLQRGDAFRLYWRRQPGLIISVTGED